MEEYAVVNMAESGNIERLLKSSLIMGGLELDNIY